MLLIIVVANTPGGWTANTQHCIMVLLKCKHFITNITAPVITGECWLEVVISFMFIDSHTYHIGHVTMVYVWSRTWQNE